MAQVVDVKAIRKPLSHSDKLSAARERKQISKMVSERPSDRKGQLPFFKPPKPRTNYSVPTLSPPKPAYKEYQQGLYDCLLAGSHRASGDGSLTQRFASSSDMRRAFHEILGGESDGVESPRAGLVLTAGSIMAKHYVDQNISPPLSE